MKNKILIVDDERMVREVFEAIVLRMGFKPVSVPVIEKAIDELNSDPGGFLAVVVDLILPCGLGWDLIDFMKSREELKDIPIIVLTGIKLSHEEVEKLNRKVLAVMFKDNFSLSNFYRLIGGLMGGNNST